MTATSKAPTLGSVIDSLTELKNLVRALELAIAGTECMDGSDRDALRELALACGNWTHDVVEDANRLNDEVVPEGEIVTLFRKWHEVRSNACGDVSHIPDDEQCAYIERHLAERDAIELRLCGMKPTTAVDVAAVVLALTQYGEEPLMGYGFGDRFVPSLLALVGVDEAALRYEPALDEEEAA